MNRRFWLFATLSGLAVLTGCASGPKYAEVASSIPAVPADKGRIYFFRSSSMMGAAIQPDIRLNGEVVGSSQPGGFFYVDRPAGSYTAATSTETEKTATFKLDIGETKYLRTSPSFGLVVGRIVVEIEDPKKAKAEIETLSLTGSAAPSRSAPATKPAAGSTKAQAPVRLAIADPQLDANGRPARVIHLEASTLEGRTWTFPHPREPERYGDVQIRFANGIASATNTKSGSSGPYRVTDDKLCVDFESSGWGHPCYYVFDASQDPSGPSVPTLWTVFSRHSSPLTIN